MQVKQKKDIRIIFSTEKEVLNKIIDIQKKDAIFSRSALINQLVDIGLQHYKKAEQVS